MFLAKYKVMLGSDCKMIYNAKDYHRKIQIWIIFLRWTILITKNVFTHKKSKKMIDYCIFLHYNINIKCVYTQKSKRRVWNEYR